MSISAGALTLYEGSLTGLNETFTQNAAILDPTLTNTVSSAEVTGEENKAGNDHFMKSDVCVLTFTGYQTWRLYAEEDYRGDFVEFTSPGTFTVTDLTPVGDDNVESVARLGAPIIEATPIPF